MTIAVVLGLAGGCSGSAAGPAPGAPTDLGQTHGPVALTTPALPALVPRVTQPAKPVPKLAPDLVRLTRVIATAISGHGTVDPAVAISQKHAAGQVIVAWTVSQDPADRGAKTRVRSDAITILRIVKASKLHYESVLLEATGAIRLHGQEKTTLVVRAKYNHAVVAATNWATVPAARVLKLTGKKPAVIAPSYR